MNYEVKFFKIIMFTYMIRFSINFFLLELNYDDH